MTIMPHSDRVGMGMAPDGGAGPMNWPKATGLLPTETVAVTVLVVVSITETVLSA
jgi:hypothetical protein